jgi:hypothetical protein
LIKVTIFDLLIFLQARRVGLVVVDVEVVALAGEPQLAVVLLVFNDVHLTTTKKKLLGLERTLNFPNF